MDIPFDIFDHIFGFLIKDPASLVACSEAHPVFSRMVEKYQYHRLTINHESCSVVTKLLSDKPQISNYVHVLRIEGKPRSHLSMTKDYFERIAVILPLFTVLECIVLSCGGRPKWERDLPQVFREAIENTLRLPTLRELHVDGYCDGFPVSMLDGHMIDCFSLCGSPEISKVADTTYPQFKSLSITGFNTNSHHISFGAWAKPRIARLQSLKYDYSSDHTLLELLEICSDTLTTLDLTLDDEVDLRYSVTAYYNAHAIPSAPLSFNLPHHLQNLTIRALIRFDCGDDPYGYIYYHSFLSTAIEILKTATSLNRITLEINVDFIDADPAVFDDVDLSPLTVLADPPGSFRRIDLYFHSDRDLTPLKLVSLLENDRGLAELMEQGMLVVHLNESAPAPADSSYLD